MDGSENAEAWAQSEDKVDEDQSAHHELDEGQLAEIEDQQLFGEDSANANLRDDDVRADLVEKVANRLVQDATRGDGILARADVNRAYLRRGLTIAECAAVERGLITREIRICDEDTVDDVANSKTRAPIAGHRYLSETEERALGRAIQLAQKFTVVEGRSNDDFRSRVLAEADKARATLVITNQRFVWQLARAKGVRRHLTVDDIYQEGMLGLLKAAEKYDPELGFRFKTYAAWWIEQQMHRAIDNDDREVRLPVHLHEQLRR